MTPEPRTLEEMNARFRAARARMVRAGQEFERGKRAPAPGPKPIPAEEPAPALVSLDEQIFQEQLEQYRATVGDKPTPRQIIATVAARHGMTASTLLGPSRCRPVKTARWEAIREVRLAFPHRSLPWLAQQFGRDHTTILHALRSMGLRTCGEGA
ncbi:MAG TPA: helix-turn-helix domain-containing protein [Microvirga sp.]|jgi:hypothetical protein|nr:helix-turn-helix domain-containing protein [Microvirga sp.]